ncbi:MAG TPA: DUF488 domain-containing protein [Bryobacteraceae bacterium]
MAIFTIGHSTLPIEKFLDMLRAHGIQLLADVRTIPKSRRNPQFAQEQLAASLQLCGIGYQHLPGLGGLRRARKDSMNAAWKNASFRGYADYMQTPEFGESLDTLIRLADDAPTVIMCAEAVPWRCHRSLIADALSARGVQVEHILSASSRKLHSYTPFARIEGESVTYPGLPLIP